MVDERNLTSYDKRERGAFMKRKKFLSILLSILIIAAFGACSQAVAETQTLTEKTIQAKSAQNGQEGELKKWEDAFNKETYSLNGLTWGMSIETFLKEQGLTMENLYEMRSLVKDSPTKNYIIKKDSFKNTAYQFQEFADITEDNSLVVTFTEDKLAGYGYYLYLDAELTPDYDTGKTNKMNILEKDFSQTQKDIQTILDLIHQTFGEPDSVSGSKKFMETTKPENNSEMYMEQWYPTQAGEFHIIVNHNWNDTQQKSYHEIIFGFSAPQ